MLDLFLFTFSVSKVTTRIFLPSLVAFIVSFFTSMGGVSGAFILLPFQMSVLGYISPSVSGTNQLFNIIAIPSGVWGYIKEKRMVWPLTWAVIIGTLPGVFIGAWIRLEYLPDAKNFKIFAGFILLYIGLKLLIDLFQKKTGVQAHLPKKMGDFVITATHFSLQQAGFTFQGQEYAFSVPRIILLCFIVGIIGGIYGIGGGAIITPFLVAFFRLPIYAVAGAALMGTFVTSIAGVILYQILAIFYAEISVAPDWYLGTLFGIGGFLGMYLGAKCQKHVPAKIIQAILCCCILFIAVQYTLMPLVNRLCD